MGTPGGLYHPHLRLYKPPGFRFKLRGSCPGGPFLALGAGVAVFILGLAYFNRGLTRLTPATRRHKRSWATAPNLVGAVGIEPPCGIATPGLRPGGFSQFAHHTTRRVQTDPFPPRPIHPPIGSSTTDDCWTSKTVGGSAQTLLCSQGVAIKSPPMFPGPPPHN